jgi:uncharacterized cupin superfamily protein
MPTVTLSDLDLVTSEALGWSAMTENMANRETDPDMHCRLRDDYPDGVIHSGCWSFGGAAGRKDYFYHNQEVVDILTGRC